jgi:chitodextrinase
MLWIAYYKYSIECPYFLCYHRLQLEDLEMMRTWKTCILLVILICAGCKQDNGLGGDGPAPTISGMTPALVTRGQRNVQGTITGTNFTGIIVVNLGDGMDIKQTTLDSSTQISVTFNVSDTAAPGPRTIQVIASGGTTSTTAFFGVRDNALPLAAFTVSPNHGARGTVFSLDASASHDPDGSITAWDWEFGDGQTASGKTVQHEYNSAGTFKIQLTVTDNASSKATSTRDLKVENQFPPVAHYNVSPTEGLTSTNFRFDGSPSTDSDGRIVKYLWDFGDGHGDGKVVSHVFRSAAKFNVKLTVVDNDGLESFVEKDIRVRGVPPLAKFTVTPSTGDITTTFHFDASDSEDPDGHIVRYKWNFDDGSQSTDKITNHKFTKDGDFGVILVVTDNDDKTGSLERGVRVGKDDGGGDDGGGDGTGKPGKCTNPAPNNGLIFGTVVGVDGKNAIVRLPAGSTCANSYYYCGDMRRASPEQFRGIIHAMTDNGDGTFSVFNDCPFQWPPDIGEKVFLYWKTCAQNHCP